MTTLPLNRIRNRFLPPILSGLRTTTPVATPGLFSGRIVTMALSGRTPMAMLILSLERVSIVSARAASRVPGWITGIAHSTGLEVAVLRVPMII